MAIEWGKTCLCNYIFAGWQFFVALFSVYSIFADYKKIVPIVCFIACNY